jgi:hypothetical protein
MVRIFQAFSLVLEKGEDGPKRIEDGPKKWKELLEYLTKSYGFTVLASGDRFCGVPKSVIVGAEFSAPSPEGIKDTFCRGSQAWDLAFESGPWYMEEK